MYGASMTILNVLSSNPLFNIACVVCFQETKLSSISPAKFRSFGGFHLQDFRSLNAEGTRGSLLTTWNPTLFDCVHEWTGRFSLTVLLKRKVDGKLFTISNVYGPMAANLKINFFIELHSISASSTGAWVMLGDFNVLLSVQDKNRPTANINDILNFREVVQEIGLVDLPIVNKSFTRSNGRDVPTLERLDRVFISNAWVLAFPRSTLHALPWPRSDHTLLVLSAYTFILFVNLFKFESYWLRYPAVLDVVSTAWKSFLPDIDPVKQFSRKIESVQSALRLWSAGISFASREQGKRCVFWIEWLDKAKERREGPGPDGLPMVFYQRFWNLIKDDIMGVFNTFYNGTTNLDKANTGWLCLIPKKKEALSANDFRPISLVHSVAKLISKVLASRLQIFLGGLINPHQAAFIKGRHIIDNFNCAHILIHHLHTNKHRAALLKIDFERAFDRVNWSFLLDLLQARGFSPRWTTWIHTLLQTTSTSVILNGTPGRIFSCKRGLRQVRGRLRRSFNILLTTTCWELWKEQNRRIFDSQLSRSNEIGRKVIDTVTLWQFAL
uniref:Uncharacterized protein n=1 Tax=Ananas comosus var. bracteatus TaxID=296719 RepID=A0A6V7QIT6_ANACO|nr:unnamed protein product [Ananas comosus var. bracteatus]